MALNWSGVWLLVLLSGCVTCQDDDDDDKIPVSEHEFPKENIATRPNYRGPGHWATPAPDSGIDLGFVPIKLYTQVSHIMS
ncbi:hypothetical protein L9F63_021555 [Diploptera punctata]|uniref:Uncharacterized protein n=1 Tax=Diploptera punctata TaxID=6984 RepID=A0AAD7ZPE8_DIPPU|nr:hypothetical protein L9F63_021555 [Diploptera punctata]